MVTIATMITCNIIIGTVAITHLQFESTVGMDYQNQSNQDYNKTEEEFMARNGNGEKGLTVYSTLMVLISSDVLLSAFLVLISRDLFKVRLSTLFVSSAYQSLNKNQEGRLALKEKMPYQSPPTVFWVLNMAAIFRQGLIVIELALAIEFWYQTSSLGSNFHGEEITKITGADLGMFGGQGVN